MNHTKGDFRICDVCGAPYDAGYMHEGGFHFCSRECIKKDADERNKKWKWIEDANKEELDECNIGEDNIGCLIFNNGNGWDLDETFYTEWY